LADQEKRRFGDGLRTVKEPAGAGLRSDPQITATVSEMLGRIEREGMDAVLHYARELDGFTGRSLEVGADELAAAAGRLPAALRTALDAGAERTRRFAGMQREWLQGFEDEVLPGVVCGQRFVPVDTVGAYLPAGRFPPQLGPVAGCPWPCRIATAPKAPGLAGHRPPLPTELAAQPDDSSHLLRKGWAAAASGWSADGCDLVHGRVVDLRDRRFQSLVELAVGLLVGESF